MPDLAMRHASAHRVMAEALEAFLPAVPMDVASYAAAHRWLDNSGGGYVGLWKHSLAPYLVEPMECLTSSLYDTTCMVGPSQCGKTAVAENWLLAAVPNDPADMLWYMQTDAGLQAYIKQTIDPMIASHRDELQRHLGLRAVDDSLHFKKFRTGMTVQFLSAVHANLINKKAGRIVTDEVDAYDPSLGDVKTLLDARRQTYFGSMLLAMSHPDLATGLDPDRDWKSGIMAIYRDSDRRLFWWPCPHCDGWSSPNPAASRVMALSHDDDPAADLDVIEASAHLECPISGCVVEDKDREAMLAAGRWIGLGEEIEPDGTVTGTRIKHRTAGFWITGTMSLLIRGGLGELARAKVKAERDHETGADDTTEQTLRNVIVKRLGLPYAPAKPQGAIEAQLLVDRAKDEHLPLGIVPKPVRFLTAALDIQAAHMELLVVGWGPQAEAFVVDRERIPGDPATDPKLWDAVLERLATKSWPLEGQPARGMKLRGLGYDSSGQPGVTNQAYAAWLRLRAGDKGRPGAEHRVRSLGRLHGRDIWTVLPLKGLGTLQAPRLQVVYPDTQRKDRKVKRTGAVPLGLFNANAYKDDLMGDLSIAAPGPGYHHFPAALMAKEPPHLFFEQIVAEKRDAAGRWTKPHQGMRNEALDLLVMNRAVAHLHGLAGIDWKTPLGFAAPWERNTLIGQLAGSSAPILPASHLPGSVAPPRRMNLSDMLP